MADDLGRRLLAEVEVVGFDKVSFPIPELRHVPCKSTTKFFTDRKIVATVSATPCKSGSGRRLLRFKTV